MGYRLFLIFCLVVCSFCKSYAHPVGELFLIDHFSSNGRTQPAHKSYINWIKNNNLGGMVFWNSDRADGLRFRKMLTQYKNAAIEAGHLPPIFSIDHEGKGVQRLTSSHGFTNLAYPNVLGRSVEILGDTRLCYLHGAIMGVELASVGFNSALATVGDVYRKQRGSRHMLRSRSISDDPQIVAECVKALVDGASSEVPFTFYTKHFPGLGSVNGNTDTGVRYAKPTSVDEIQSNLKPYRDAIQWANRSRKSSALGLMSSNAYYPHYDSEFPAVESEVILTDLLRDELKFKGLVVTDALWVGQYEGLGSSKYRQVLAQMVLAGVDQLMIPASRFNDSYRFFASFYQGDISDSLAQRLMKANGLSRSELISVFKSRVNESVQRIRKTKTYLSSQSIRLEEGTLPRAYTQDLSAEYAELLKAMNLRNSRP